MGCIFGYAGKPLDGLLERMAQQLSHRCQAGVERRRLVVHSENVVEIGHGIAPWTNHKQVALFEEKSAIFGYSGVIFDPPQSPPMPAPGIKMPGVDAFDRMLARAQANPKKLLSRLEGAFTAVYADPQKLLLARDAAGIKVLYWTKHKERLVFASEIKALFADPLVEKRLRPGALPEYLTFSYIPGERTMFDHIFELQPGTLLTSQDDTVCQTRYFTFEHLEETENEISHTNGLVAKWREYLATSVSQCCRFQTDPPAVFLSGGIDSSSVLALLAQHYPNRRLKTFSIHFGAPYANENEFVAMMIARYNTDHTWLEIKPNQFINRMDQIIWFLDDPIGDPITVPNFLMAETASKVTSVVLNGEGGDPCLGGPKNIPMLLSDFYGPLPDEKGAFWREKTYLDAYRKCYSDLARILSPDVWQASGREEALVEIIAPFFRADRPRHYLNRLMSINIRLKGANLILPKVDKMTSANGLLALAPLFSKQIIENSMKCPPTWKLAGNIEKNILKKAVAGIVPLPIVTRPKSGMMVPVRFWFRKEMRQFAKHMLSKKKLRQTGYFNQEYIKKLINYDKTEIQSARHGLKLWMLVTFMLWHEQMVERSF